MKHTYFISSSILLRHDPGLASFFSFQIIATRYPIVRIVTRATEMQSINGTKVPCFTCKKAVGIFTCRGCGKDFCYRHVAEHRQELGKQMEGLTVDHNQLQQTIAEQEAQPNRHPLMKKIDEWEQQSIKKIQQAAENIRKDLLTVLHEQRSAVSKKLTHLKQALNHARGEDDYVETDLKEWLDKLEKLKVDLNAAQIIDFNEKRADGNTLIQKIVIPNASHDFFMQPEGDVTIIEEGKVALHGPTRQYAFARGRVGYSSGRQRLLFKIEQGNTAALFGIVSKNAASQSLSLLFTFNTGYQHQTGMSGTYVNINNGGIVCFSFNDQYHAHHWRNVSIELQIDCDQREVRVKTNVAGSNQVQKVDLGVCPFPWQFFIGFLNAGDRIRLCSNDELETSETVNSYD